MLVTRFNFETNSSSMHSLSIRRTEGDYTPEEMRLTESISNNPTVDTIITTNVGDIEFTTEEILRDCYMYEQELDLYAYEIDFINSPMQVLHTFREKLMYLLASAMSSDNKEQMLDEITSVFCTVLPGCILNLEEMSNVYMRGRCMTGGVNREIAFNFIKDNNITIQDFLLKKKYIVIINYEEYLKMRRLNMVDESTIINMYPNIEIEEPALNIIDGVWKLSSCDITFERSPFRVLGTIEGKARYALATYRSENIDEVLAVLQEVYPNLKSIELPLDRWGKGNRDTGYASDSAMPLNIPLREFILNKKYVIISDGDEYCIWSGFKSTPLFNQNEYPNEKIDED